MDKSILDLDELFKIKPNSNIWHIDLLIENLLENKKKHKRQRGGNPRGRTHN